MKALLLLFLFLAGEAQAQVRVAFLEIRDAQGNILQLEPGGRFAHVALAVAGGWLQVYPGRKVEIVPDLSGYGQVAEVLTLDQPSPGEQEIEKYLGLPYDTEFSWSDERMYCAELLAKLLHVNPTPMKFEGPQWGPEYTARRGEPGISPDELYWELKKRQ